MWVLGVLGVLLCRVVLLGCGVWVVVCVVGWGCVGVW